MARRAVRHPCRRKWPYGVGGVEDGHWCGAVAARTSHRRGLPRAERPEQADRFRFAFAAGPDTDRTMATTTAKRRAGGAPAGALATSLDVQALVLRARA